MPTRICALLQLSRPVSVSRKQCMSTETSMRTFVTQRRFHIFKAFFISAMQFSIFSKQTRFYDVHKNAWDEFGASKSTSSMWNHARSEVSAARQTCTLFAWEAIHKSCQGPSCRRHLRQGMFVHSAGWIATSSRGWERQEEWKGRKATLDR